jgi:hypothetical protein
MDFEDTTAARRSLVQLRQLRANLPVVSIGDGVSADPPAVSVNRPASKQALHEAVQRLLANRNTATS